MFFSVIIPTFNRAKLLRNCLNSLVQQSFKDFEVLICDDGSVDETEQVIETFKINLDIKYYKLENSGGPAYPRNVGISKAKGQWVCFLDSDDEWYSNKLEKCYQIITNYIFKEKKYSILFHDFDIYNSDGKVGKSKGRKISYNNTLYDLLSKTSPIVNSSICINREVLPDIGLIDESKEVRFVEDLDFCLRIAQLNYKFYYLPLSLGKYNVHNSNNSYDFINQIDKHKFLYNRYSKYLTKNESIIAKYTLNYIIGNLYKNAAKLDTAVFYFKKSVKSPIFTIKFKSFFKIIIFSKFFTSYKI